MRYMPVIGLEIHVEMSTAAKVFCDCSAEFGGEENTRCCPRCTGLPGTLPLLGRGPVEAAVRAGIALGCNISKIHKFDRKNYFYPDLPKAYQISQFYSPICTGGGLEINGRFIRIHHIHIEEDAGKLNHDDYEDITLVDCNRCGVPLIEIVTEPDIRSAEEARQFVEAVALRLKYAGVSDCRMERGSMRADVNVSIMPEGSTKFGTRVEMKNLNSLKSIVRSIEYEIERQSEILNRGGKVEQETRRFNENHGNTKAMRTKEEANDYRYFPDPDIPPIIFDDEDIEAIKSTLPEMPEARFARYTDEYGIGEFEAGLLVNTKELSDLYESAIGVYNNYKGIALFIAGELMRRINIGEIAPDNLPFTASQLARLVEMTDKSVVTANAAKEVFRLMCEKGGDPDEIAKENGLIMQNDRGAIEAAVAQVLQENQKAVAEYREGSKKVLGFLIGQTTKKLGKGANPAIIREILQAELDK